MIYLSRRSYEELEMAGKLICPRCQRIKEGISGLSRTSFSFCDSDQELMLDWNDIVDLEKQGKLKWFASTGLMAEWATLLLTEDGA